MLSRSALARRAALRCAQQPLNRRCLAAPASGSFQYETGDHSGVKYASRDLAGPTTTLALVAKAGTRYQYLPGLTEALEKFAFKSTERRSALRITREAELLGSELSAFHSRENLVIGAKFLRDDLPYFVELLAEVATQTQYIPYVYDEEVEPMINLYRKKELASTEKLAVDSAHALAFHRGLGAPLHPTSSLPYKKYLNSPTIGEFASVAYSKPNIAVVANGAEHSELSKWVGEFFSTFRDGTSLASPQTKYYGGEERIAHASGNSMVLAFPGSSSFTGGFYKPEIAVLGSLLGGESSIKWSPGFTTLAKAAVPGASVATKSAIYSDAGLLYVTINGSASSVADTAFEVVKSIKEIAAGNVSKEDITKAVARAKFKELESGQNLWAGIELTGAGLTQQGKPYQLDESAKAISGVTEEQVKKAAKELLDYKSTVSAVGDLYVLPYAEELGLKV